MQERERTLEAVRRANHRVVEQSLQQSLIRRVINTLAVLSQITSISHEELNIFYKVSRS